MSSTNVFPLLVLAGSAIGVSLYVTHLKQSTVCAPTAAPKETTGLVRRNSDLAWASEEGAAIRRKAIGEGHAGTGSMGADEDLKRRHSGDRATVAHSVK